MTLDASASPSYQRRSEKEEVVLIIFGEQVLGVPWIWFSVAFASLTTLRGHMYTSVQLASVRS